MLKLAFVAGALLLAPISAMAEECITIEMAAERLEASGLFEIIGATDLPYTSDDFGLLALDPEGNVNMSIFINGCFSFQTVVLGEYAEIDPQSL